MVRINLIGWRAQFLAVIGATARLGRAFEKAGQHVQSFRDDLSEAVKA